MSDLYSTGFPNGQDRSQERSQDRSQDQSRDGNQNPRQPQGFSEQARGVAQDLKAKAGEVKDTVQQAAKERAEAVKTAASGMASEAREKVETAAMHQKSLGADYVGAIAGAINRAAGEFDSELPQAAHYIRQASEQVNGFADTIRQRDMRELAAEVQDFARKQPTLFFGGAVILGFAALRFFKSASIAPEQPNAFTQRREEQGA